jgi:4-amino-4-deoxy-L-arabinose transferase-like glycosyltransferase
LLAAILVISIAIRAYRIGEAFGGFHGFNEAFYALNAQGHMNRVLTLFTSPSDFNNPPLFTFLTIISFKLFGVSEILARIVPILSAILAIIYTYRQGVVLYDQKVSVAAAALLGVNPAHVLLGRNVQVDSLLVFLSWLLYIIGCFPPEEMS